MNKTIKSFVLAAAVALSSPLARAAYNNNDLILGFEQATFDNATQTYTGPNDYIIDLGSAASVGVGGSSMVNLSSSFDLFTFSMLYGSFANGLNMGVVGGTPSGSQQTLFLTVSRGSLGDPNAEPPYSELRPRSAGHSSGPV